MEKLRWPMDVFARETNMSPRSAERSDRHDKSETCLKKRSLFNTRTCKELVPFLWPSDRAIHPNMARIEPVR